MSHRTSSSSVQSTLFPGGGEMGALIRHYDWAQHPLGDPSGWSASLVNSVRIMLHSGFPMFIWWSDQFFLFHNDRYLPALGRKHPAALGSRAPEVWSSIWPTFGPIAQGILDGNDTYYAEDVPVTLDRHGFEEETYWTFTYSPIFGDAERTEGILGIAQEVTPRILSERRLALLKAVADQTAMTPTVAEVGARTAELLHYHPDDVPLALVYLLEADGQSARRVGCTDTVPDDQAPATVDLTANPAPWPLVQVQREQRPVMVPDPASADRPRAVVMPLLQPSQQQLRGFLVVGVSPRLAYTEAYRRFFQLLTAQVATAMAQVEAREEADRQRARLYQLFQQAPVAIGVFRGPQFIVELLNPAAAELLDQTPERVMGRPAFEVNPELREPLEELLTQVFCTGEPFEGHEMPISLRRGERWHHGYYNFVYQPLRDEQQTITGVVSMAIEVTEQVRARREVETKNHELATSNARLAQALREADQLTAVLNNSSDFVGLASPQGKGLYINPAGRAMMGLPTDQPADAVQISDFFFEEDLPFVQETILPTVMEQGLWVGEMRWRHFGTGRAIPMLYNSFAVYDPATGELQGLATISRDITERQQREEKLQEYREQLTAANEELTTLNEELVTSNEELIETNQRLSQTNAELDESLQEGYQLTALLENSSDFIGLASPEGEVVYMNPAARRMVGIPPEQELSELKINDFFAEEDLPFVQDTILPRITSHGVWVGEYRFRDFRTGATVPVYYNLFAVKNPSTGQLLGVATISTDISERQRREAKLQEYRERLAATNEELRVANEELLSSNHELVDTNDQLTRVNADLDNFVYTASHDLKAPISNIQGLVQVLESNLSEASLAAPSTQRVLQMIRRSVTRFMDTIADLSEIARLQKQSDLPTEPVGLDEVIAAVCLDIAPAIEQANARVEVDVAACGPVHFAPKNLRSVVYNLLSNAVKYRDPQRTPVVRVHCAPEGEHQVLTVADNGLGLEPAQLDKLFSMFQRFHDHVEGTGVGLYIVKKVVENAGGRIEVDSQVGQGTTFRVFFQR